MPTRSVSTCGKTEEEAKKKEEKERKMDGRCAVRGWSHVFIWIRFGSPCSHCSSHKHKNKIQWLFIWTGSLFLSLSHSLSLSTSKTQGAAVKDDNTRDDPTPNYWVFFLPSFFFGVFLSLSRAFFLFRRGGPPPWGWRVFKTRQNSVKTR